MMEKEMMVARAALLLLLCLNACAVSAAAGAGTTTVVAVGATDTSGVLKRMKIERRAVGPKDVDIEIHFCGVCHSDLHQICAEWPSDFAYPMVPGHEIVGKVRSVGQEVTKHKVGDLVGVGCLVDSCRTCEACQKKEEPYCDTGFVATYTSLTDWYGKGPKTTVLEGHEGQENTYGGYSQAVVVDEDFVLRMPSSLELARAAPLLCAGITTYSPLVHWKAKELGAKMNVAVVGYGGLGHMAVRQAVAMNNNVVVFSTSESKRKDIEAAGAKFILSKDAAQMKAAASSQHLIIDTVSAHHDIKPLLKTLKTDGTLCMVGLPPQDLKLHAFDVVGKRKSVSGSLIGGLQETQDMLDFCAMHGIAADIELIPPQKLNHAMVALRSNASPSRRFVIDVKAHMTDDEGWEVEEDAGIKVEEQQVHREAKIFPPSALHPKSQRME